MIRQLSLLLVCSIWALAGYGQDNGVSEAVRAMIERSQAGSQFEQSARMQMSVQYQEFLDNLSGNAQRRSQIEAALISVLSERAELSSRVTRGQATSAELAAVNDFAYLRSRLAPLLNAAELSQLGRRQQGPSDSQLKKDYAVELEQVASGLTEANRELVLDTLVRHMQAGARNRAAPGELTVDDLVSREIQSVAQAGEELQTKLSGEQLQFAMTFLSRLQSNLYMNRSMSDGH